MLVSLITLLVFSSTTTSSLSLPMGPGDEDLTALCLRTPKHNPKLCIPLLMNMGFDLAQKVGLDGVNGLAMDEDALLCEIFCSSGAVWFACKLTSVQPVALNRDMYAGASVYTVLYHVVRPSICRYNI